MRNRDRQTSGVSRVKPLASRRSAIVSVLDIGSSKICCMIARVKPRDGEALRRRTHAVEVLGFATTRSRGIKSGVVVDLEEAEQRHPPRRRRRRAHGRGHRRQPHRQSLLRPAEERGLLRPRRLSADRRRRGRYPARAGGRRRAFRHAAGAWSCTPCRSATRSTATAASTIRTACSAGTLGVDMHVVTADEAPLRNLELAINRCHLEVETVVATPYASGLAALVDDEAELGVACDRHGRRHDHACRSSTRASSSMPTPSPSAATMSPSTSPAASPPISPTPSA